MFRYILFDNLKGVAASKTVFTKMLLAIACISLSVSALNTSSISYANVPAYAPVINGQYSGTLYVYGVPVSIIMSVTSDTYGLGHKFTLRGLQDDLFIISGNCDCLDSGAILAEHGLFSECLGIDMGLLDQVELEGWFTDYGYRGELKLFSAGSDVSIPSLVGIFDLQRQ